jgi:hypothetical protein
LFVMLRVIFINIKRIILIFNCSENKYNQQHCLCILYNIIFHFCQDTKEQLYDMVPMIPTIETISVVCLTEDQEDGDLILDFMVDGINMVSYFVILFFFKYI